jgi:hypothetical protein
MAWCSVKAQGQLYLYLYIPLTSYSQVPPSMYYLKQLYTQPNNAATFGNIFGNPVVEELSVP